METQWLVWPTAKYFWDEIAQQGINSDEAIPFRFANAESNRFFLHPFHAWSSSVLESCGTSLRISGPDRSLRGRFVVFSSVLLKKSYSKAYGMPIANLVVLLKSFLIACWLLQC